MGGNKFDVGFAEGLQGLANLVSAMPAGYIATWPRFGPMGVYEVSVPMSDQRVQLVRCRETTI